MQHSGYQVNQCDIKGKERTSSYFSNSGITCIDDCGELADGSYQSCHGCDFYLVCVSGVTTRERCETGYIWNTKTELCVERNGTCSVGNGQYCLFQLLRSISYGKVHRSHKMLYIDLILFTDTGSGGSRIFLGGANSQSGCGNLFILLKTA